MIKKLEKKEYDNEYKALNFKSTRFKQNWKYKEELPNFGKNKTRI